MNTITTRTDLETYIANAGPYDAADIERATAAIQADDHPGWGTDWAEYLDAIDLDVLVSEAAS